MECKNPFHLGCLGLSDCTLWPMDFESEIRYSKMKNKWFVIPSKLNSIMKNSEN